MLTIKYIIFIFSILIIFQGVIRIEIYTTLILLLLFNIQAQAQPNVDVANATLVNTFPYVENNFSSAGGGTATGLQGTCSTIPCCSVLVYKTTANGIIFAFFRSSKDEKYLEPGLTFRYRLGTVSIL